MLKARVDRQIGEFRLQIEFEIGSQILVLFGPSGAGKTMTLNALAGLLVPDSGQIVLNNRVLYDQTRRIHLPPRDRHIGFVFQNYALFPHLNVWNNVAFGVAKEAGFRARVAEMLELMHLTEFANRYPEHLSGGQQQRVALARALAPRPDLLLLDEPLSALDAATRMRLRQELRAIQANLQIPMVFVTHDLGEAYFLADQLAVVDGGSILQIGAPGEVLRLPINVRVARAVGVKNILAGVVVTQEPECSRVRVGEVIVTAPPSPYAPGALVHVLIRPERIVLLRPERAGRSSDENALRGRVVREASDGSNVILYYSAEETRLTQAADYDLQIELPVYIYERLDLAHQREWSVSLRKNAIHLVP